MPDVIVRILGDERSLSNAYRKAASNTKAFSGTVKDQARQTIVAQVQQRQSLEKLAAEYRLVASNAKRGSDAQVTAARLAAGAERQLAASYSVTATHARRGRSSISGLDRDVGKATRGALAGSGAFRAMGRSLAFASGGFLAFASAGQFLRTSIDAARDAQVTQKQLAAQFKASGQSLTDYQGAIERTTNRLSLLAGIENDELKAGFTTIFRTTGNVSKALRDLGTAADLARAKHMDLNKAAIVIAKTEAGNTTLLRRQGLQISKNATVEEALAQVRRQLAGQARAGTTAQERFGAVLHNTEEIIGAALLPTLNRYLNSGAKWLTQMNESGRLQKDVAATMRTVGSTISAVRAVLGPLVGAFKLLGNVVGGTKNEVKLLVGAFVAFKIATKVNIFANVIADIALIGTSARTSKGQVRGLQSALLAVGGRSVIAALGAAAAAVAAVVASSGAAPNVPGLPTGPSQAAQLAKLAKQDKLTGAMGKAAMSAAGLDQGIPFARALENPTFVAVLWNEALRAGLVKNPPATPSRIPGARGQTSSVQASAQTIPQQVVGGRFIPKLTPGQQRAIDLAGDASLSALRAQAAFDRQQLAAIERRWRAGKISNKTYADETVKFKNDLASQEGQIATILEQQANDAKAKTKAASDRAKNALKSISDSISAFIKVRLIPGFSATLKAADQQRADALKAQTQREQAAREFKVPLKLQVAVARAALTEPTDDDRKALKAIESAAQKALKSQRLGLQGQYDALTTIRDVWDQLAGITTAKKTVSGYAAVSTRALTRGLDLTRQQRIALEGRYAQAAAHGGRTPIQGAAGALGQVIITGPVTITGVTDINDLHDKLLKKAKRGAGQRRGGNAGSYMGLH